MSWILLATMLAVAPAPQGNTLNVPGQFGTIQAAIVAAMTSDTVLVAPGTYVENIDFLGKAITVTSTDGPAMTTIDGNGAGSVVSFIHNEGPDSVLEGFTITNGTGTLFTGPITGLAGGGIYCLGASPTIRDNIVSGNTVTGTGMTAGGGIGCLAGASPQIAGNTIHNNAVVDAAGSAGGGGIGCFLGSSPTIVDNDIHSNSATGGGLCGAGGILCQADCAPTIARNLIHANTTQFGGGMQININSTPTIVDNAIYGNVATVAGGGIQLFQANLPVRIVNNTIYGNTAQGRGGGGIECNTASIGEVRDSILWGNTAPNGSGDEISMRDTASLTIHHSAVQGGQAAASVQPPATLTWGAGMLALDPQFVNVAGGDYRLLAGSPCIDAGDPLGDRCVETDLGGNPRLLDGLLTGRMRTDIGCHEFDNVRLEITGTPTPGGTVMFHTTGRAGMIVALVLAGGRGQVCVPPLGGVFLDPMIPWIGVPWGAMPSPPRPVQIPIGMSTELLLVFQEVALDPVTMAGNTSNPVELTVR